MVSYAIWSLMLTSKTFTRVATPATDGTGKLEFLLGARLLGVKFETVSSLLIVARR